MSTQSQRTRVPPAMGIVHRPRVLLLFAAIFVLCIAGGCRSSSRVVREVGGRNAEGETLNYYVHLQVVGADGDDCRRMIVRIYPKSKLYAGHDRPPPDRLKLIDSDCAQPIRFERASYLREGITVWRTGDELPSLWMRHQKLEHELYGWLFRRGL